MAKIDVTVSIDEGLLAKAAGLNLSLILADALHNQLDGREDGELQRWAEENALAIEALAGDWRPKVET
jgi:post-segregation antitoxin (ccd killing protein)